MKVKSFGYLIIVLFLTSSCDELKDKLEMSSNLDVIKCINNKNPKITGIEISQLSLGIKCVEKFHKELD